MKDPVIEAKVADLKSLVDQVNSVMSDLQDMNVEVRISYVDKNDPNYSTVEHITRQSIRLWKVEEHNGYL